MEYNNLWAVRFLEDMVRAQMIAEALRGVTDSIERDRPPDVSLHLGGRTKKKKKKKKK
jgi:hypothetical protein